MPAAVVLINQIDGIELHCTYEESVSTQVKTSESPVEEGVDITDHAVLQPIEVTVHAAISNHNINARAYQGGLIADAYDKLLSLQKNIKLVTLVTGISSHNNMLMIKLDRKRVNTAGEVLDFTAKFREIRYAENPEVASVISVGGSSGSAASGGGGASSTSGTTDVGSSQNSEVSTQNGTLLADAARAIGFNI